MSFGEPAANDQAPFARLMSVAIRVYRMEAMVDFYQEAFGVIFAPGRVGDLEVQFGFLGDVLLKLVPLASEQEADEFPVHQLGFEVEDLDAVLELALKYGGSILQEPVSRMHQWHAAIRDPDGNSLEVYSLAADR